MNVHALLVVLRKAATSDTLATRDVRTNERWQRWQGRCVNTWIYFARSTHNQLTHLTCWRILHPGKERGALLKVSLATSRRMRFPKRMRLRDGRRRMIRSAKHVSRVI
ncbi:hypothetical protein IQ06DRAFT_27046 [Phaeosphaeriaceae sp. SRC1lsM3a]|nr:hypothetical protein IQ06DRAFT_27046 [Stagonospora sp. SRC1lsM3a]